MKKRRLLAIVMAMMMVVAFGMTSMAASKQGTYVYGILNQVGSGATAFTRNTTDGGGSAYVSVTVEYMSSAGNIYTSSPATKKGTGTATATKTVTGSFVSAWSSHGRTGKEFALYL